MKNIHLFETKNAFDKAKSGLILPRVSYITENKVVEYNPHHDYVEIARIKWATMNVGANKITDYGLYFQWGDTQGYTSDQVSGDTEPKKAFSEEDYNSELLTKYNTEGMTLALDDDAVHAAWGGSWRMPTNEEFGKLGDAVTTEFVTDYNNSGVNGLLCTAKDGSKKTLFFPACGYSINGSTNAVGRYGSYWSSSLLSSDLDYAYGLDFNNVYVYWQYGNLACCGGHCVRGVLDEK